MTGVGADKRLQYKKTRLQAIVARLIANRCKPLTAYKVSETRWKQP